MTHEFGGKKLRELQYCLMHGREKNVVEERM
jgi:hypothetical protein